MINTADTRADALESIKPCAKTLRAQILAAIVASGLNGKTDDELQRELGIQGSTERPRRVELLEAGKIIQSGEVRPTASGRKAVVWISNGVWS